ncbi:restriction endonuclease subunit S [Candidatus Binatia bacterium]|nr:restriction endonuclease subunit S [Candidatus Binatia bacterium]MCK6588532.1 restriction endonuclease subunit S [Polyangiaceae bacterium]
MGGETIWPTRPLKDCAVWYSGGTPNKATPRYWGGSIPWISAKSLNDYFVSDSEDRVTEEGARNGTRLVPKDSILFIVRGMSLKSEFRMGIATRPVTFNQDLKALVAVDDVVPAYLAYAIRSKTTEILQMVGEAGHGTGVLPTDRIQSLEIPVPSLEEQHAVAAIVGALDAKIELNRKMNATLEAMARALFKSWFVDFDPVRAKAEGRAPSGMDAETAKLFPSEFVDSELGPIPKGWRATTLGTEVERCGGAVQTGPFGSQLHASDYVPEGVPVVMPKDIGGRRVSTASIARVPEHDALRLSRHRLQPGDVVYSRRGDVERHALIGARETGWLCGTGCLLVRLGPNWPSPMFASFALDRPETRAWISQHAIGATMPNLNTGILSAVPLVMPSDDVLRAFAAAVDPLQALVVIRDAETGLLAKTRDELLPRLLSGELPVDARERAVEEVA